MPSLDKKKVNAMLTGDGGLDIGLDMPDMETTVPPRTAADWNTLVPVGTAVRYWPVAGRWREFVDTETVSEAWTLASGHHVVLVKGRSGGVSLDHLAFNVGT